MREKLIRFMTGRNGADNLSRAVSFVVIAFLVVGFFTDARVSRVLWVFAVLGMVYTYFRIFRGTCTRDGRRTRSICA